MDGPLRRAMLAGGARGGDPPDDFGAPVEELRAALETCILVDRTRHARLRGAAPDLLSLLHRSSTADLRALEPGAGRPTVITTAKGRIVDRVFVHRSTATDVLLAGGSTGTTLFEHLQRLTFRERTGLLDVTGATVWLALSGPRVGEALAAAGLVPPEPHAVAGGRVGDVPVEILGHDGLFKDGASIVAGAEHGDSVWRALAGAVERAGGRPAGARAALARRILRGLPEVDHELTLDHNPLEAGLHDAISFSKGCYTGQEVVARLRTYDKVSRALLGLRFDEGAFVPPPGAPLFKDGSPAGTVTSAVLPPGSSAPIALAYLKRREAGPGDRVRVGGADGPAAQVVDLPFAR